MSQSPDTLYGVEGNLTGGYSWLVLLMAKVREVAAVSQDFFTITLLFGTIASWGGGINIYRFEDEIWWTRSFGT